MSSELLYEIEIGRETNSFVAKMLSNSKKILREYSSPTFEELLEQIAKDIQDEHED